MKVSFNKSVIFICALLMVAITGIGGEKKRERIRVYAGYTEDNSVTLRPAYSTYYLDFKKMFGSDGVKRDFIFHSKDTNNYIILINTKDNSLWKSQYKQSTYEFSSPTCNSVCYSTLDYLYITEDGVITNPKQYETIYKVYSSVYEFIGYKYTPTNLSYKPTNTTSLKFNEMNLSQFRTSFSTLQAGNTVPIKIHKKYVGNLIVKTTSDKILYLEDYLDSSVRLFEFNIESAPDFTNQKISTRPIIDINGYITRLGGKNNLSKRLVSN